jgi:peptide/nickel transport system permease protein
MARGSWVRLVAGRLVALVATLIIVPTLFFAITTALNPLPPGFPPGPPVLQQIGDYMVRTYLHFDWGNAGPPGYESELGRLLDGLPTDLTLCLSGMLLGAFFGLIGGSVAARHPRTVRARVLMGASAVALSTPPYLFGFAVLMLFAPHTGSLLQVPFVSELSDYRLLEEGPASWVRAMWVPCLVVSLPVAAQVMRMTESGLRDVLDDDVVRSARAKGMRESRVVHRHALPLVAAPVLTLAGANTVALLTNVALMESAFNLPGAFRNLHTAVSNNDLPFLQALVLESAIFIVVANFVVDMLQAAIDPRVRFQE